MIVSGAMDAHSLRIANMLVGNEEGEAALEITLMGPTIKVEKKLPDFDNRWKFITYT
ncbi:hypothetical protein RCO48_27200 [Peribacillus frigoritolerans]|nr:hypothetical protein [Peribacillus frigoritolerans]